MLWRDKSLRLFTSLLNTTSQRPAFDSRSIVWTVIDFTQYISRDCTEHTDSHYPANTYHYNTLLSCVWTDTERGVLLGLPKSAICVQRFDDSLNSAIRITYRISLRSSSLREPRYPLLRVVFFNVQVNKRVNCFSKNKFREIEQHIKSQLAKRCGEIG